MRKCWLTIVLTVILAFTFTAANVFAADNTFVLDPDSNGTTQHDVVVKGEPMTVYCLQRDYAWPTTSGTSGKNPTKYYDSTPEKELLNDSQLEQLKRLMYAGYPHNGLGILDDWYEMLADFPEMADNITSEITQAAIWQLTYEWEVPGNKYNPYGKVYDDEWKEYVDKLTAFARSEKPIAPPEGEEVEITGKQELVKQSDGTWKSKPLKVVDPAGFELTFNLSSTGGVTAVDEYGDAITAVKENQEFYLVADDIADIEENAGVTASVSMTYPSSITHYLTDDQALTQTGTKPYQTMLSVGIATKKLSGDFNVTAVDTGSLTVRKEMHDKSSADKAEGQTFAFSITLNGQSGKTFNAIKRDSSGQSTDTTVEFKNNGVGSVSLGADEEIEIIDIPDGVSYTVSENTIGTNWKAAYKVDGKSADSAAGKINDTSTVIVTNDYQFTSANAAITASKELVGNGAPSIANYAGKFTFLLFPEAGEFDNPMPEGSVQNEKDGNRWEKTATNSSENGTGISFGEIEFDHPGEYHYIIIEEDESENNITEDPNYWKVTVDVTDDEGTLKAETSYQKNASSDSSDRALFSNTYTQHEADKYFNVVKGVKNNSSDTVISPKGYKFEIKPAPQGDLTEDKYPCFGDGDSRSYTFTTDENGEAVSDKIRFTEEWFKGINGDPVNGTTDDIVLKYTLKELDADPQELGAALIMDQKTVDVTETVTRTVSTDGVVQLKAETSYSGDPAEPAFLNKYTASGDCTINVKKEFDPSDYKPAEGETYSFIIEDGANGGEGYSIANDKKIDLVYKDSEFVQTGGKVSFTKAGRYTFAVRENHKNLKEGMSYDASKKEIVVEVTDTGTGKLSATVVPGTITFTNTYDSEVKAELKVAKKLTGRDWKEDEVFPVKLDYGEVEGIHGPDTAEMTKDGATIEGITITQVGEYNVKIREVDTGLPGIAYDTTEHTATIKVIRSGNDLQVDSIKYDGEADIPVFHNKVTNLTVSKAVEDTTGAIDSGMKFAFFIKLSDDTIHGDYGDITFYNGEAIVKLAADEKITATDLPGNINYTVKEIYSEDSEKAEKAEEVFDTNVSLNGGDKKSGSEYEGKLEDGDSIAIEFTNALKYANLEVSKKVIDKTRKLDLSKEEYTFNVTIKGGLFDLFVDKSINGEFGDMKFKNGIAKVVLKDGETAVAENLPSGVKYQVEEINAKGYVTTVDVTESAESPKTDAISGKTQVKASGLLSSGIVDQVKFTNTKNNNSDSGADTGDRTNLLIVWLGIIVSLVGIISIVVFRRTAKK